MSQKNDRKKRRHRENKGISLWLLCVIVLTMGIFTACSVQSEDDGNDNQTANVELNDESVSAAADKAGKSVVLRVGDQEITKAEAYVYLYLMQMPYESYYGSKLWGMEREENYLWGDWLLAEVKSQIIELCILAQRAEADGISLDEATKISVEEAAVAAMNTEISLRSEASDESADGQTMAQILAEYGVTQEIVTAVYLQSALAGLYYEIQIEDASGNLSEEEQAQCQGITIEQIFIGAEDTTHLSDGQTAEELAEELLLRVENGEDFETLAKFYSSENAQWILSFDLDGYVFDTMGWLEECFVLTAWALEAGECSDVIETSYGYHILLCTAKNTEELMEEAMSHALQVQAETAFAQVYEGWLSETECVTESGWQDIKVIG